MEKQRKRVENVSMWQTNFIILYCAVCDNSSTIEEALNKAGKVRQAAKREENVQGRSELRGEISGIRTPASSKGAKALCGPE